VANTVTIVVISLAVALGAFLAQKVRRKLVPSPSLSPERAKRLRKIKLWSLAYLGTLVVIGLAVWGATGSALAGVLAPVAVMFCAPLVFHLARPALDHRQAVKIVRDPESPSN
jgi:hypothetical protein